MKILFVGPQGSGKSTQGKLLAEYLKIPYISTGDIFREMAPVNEMIRGILGKGELIDDWTTIQVVRERVKKPDCKNGFILDGYPRNLAQLRLFDPGFDKVIYLKLSDEQALKRLLARGREDDTKESIAKRLKTYHEQADSMLDYYRRQSSLSEVDGQETIEEIQQRVRDQLNG
jgi:adenylate kinase